DLVMVEPVLHPIDYRPFRKERRPALADVLQDCVLSDDVQICILLSRERRRGQIFRGGTGTHSIRIVVSQLAKSIGNRISNALSDWCCFDGIAYLSGDFANAFRVLYC